MDILQLDVFAPTTSTADAASLIGVGLLHSTDVAINVVRVGAGESVSHDDIPVHRIVIILSGCGHVSDGIQWHAFRPQQVLRWPADENHEIHADTDITAMLIEWAGDYAYSPQVDPADKSPEPDPQLVQAASPNVQDLHTPHPHHVDAMFPPQATPIRDARRASSTLPLQRPTLPGDSWDGVTERRAGSDRRWSLVPKAAPTRQTEESERRVAGRRSTDFAATPPAKPATVGPRSSAPEDVAAWRYGYPKDYAPVTDLDHPSIFRSGYSSSTWAADNVEQTTLAGTSLADPSRSATETWIPSSDQTGELQQDGWDLEITSEAQPAAATPLSAPSWSQETWQAGDQRPKARGRRADRAKSVDARPESRKTEQPHVSKLPDIANTGFQTSRLPVVPVPQDAQEQSPSDDHVREQERDRRTPAADADELGRRAELRASIRPAVSPTPIFDGAAQSADVASYGYDNTASSSAPDQPTAATEHDHRHPGGLED